MCRALINAHFCNYYTCTECFVALNEKEDVKRDTTTKKNWMLNRALTTLHLRGSRNEYQAMLKVSRTTTRSHDPSSHTAHAKSHTTKTKGSFLNGI